MARNNIFTRMADAISTGKANRAEKLEQKLKDYNTQQVRKNKPPLTLDQYKHKRRKRNINRSLLLVSGIMVAGIIFSQSEMARSIKNERNAKKEKAYQEEVKRQSQMNMFHENKVITTGPLTDKNITWDQAVKNDTIDIKPTERKKPEGSLSDRLKNIEKRNLKH